MQRLLRTWNTIAARLFAQADNRRQKRLPAPYLSGASKCVWQMDREA